MCRDYDAAAKVRAYLGLDARFLSAQWAKSYAARNRPIRVCSSQNSGNQLDCFYLTVHGESKRAPWLEEVNHHFSILLQRTD